MNSARSRRSRDAAIDCGKVPMNPRRVNRRVRSFTRAAARGSGPDSPPRMTALPDACHLIGHDDRQDDNRLLRAGMLGVLSVKTTIETPGIVCGCHACRVTGCGRARGLGHLAPCTRFASDRATCDLPVDLRVWLCHSRSAGRSCPQYVVACPQCVGADRPGESPYGGNREVISACRRGLARARRLCHFDERSC